MQFLVGETPWLIHHLMRNDHIRRIYVRSDLAACAPDRQLPVLTRVSIPLRGERGHWFGPEHDRMLDAVADGLESPPPATFLRRWLFGEEVANRTLFVARCTQEGTVELYFYSAQEIPKRVLVSLERCAPGQDFDVSSREDPKWDEYLQRLHPGRMLVPLLGSWAQLARRKEHGDELSVERPVDHTLCFASQGGLEEFLQDIENGTDWSVRRFETELSDYPCGLDVTQSHALTRETTDMYIHFLCSRAFAHQGIYDGWGAFEVPARPGV